MKKILSLSLLSLAVNASANGGELNALLQQQNADAQKNKQLETAQAEPTSQINLQKKAEETIRPMTISSVSNGLDRAMEVVTAVAESNGQLTPDLLALMESGKANKDEILNSIIEAKKAVELLTGEEYVLAAFGLYLLGGGELPILTLGSNIQYSPTIGIDALGVMFYNTSKGGSGIGLSWKGGGHLEIRKRDASASSISQEGGSRFQKRPFDFTIFLVPKMSSQKLTIKNFRGTYLNVALEVDFGKISIPFGAMYSHGLLQEGKVFAIPIRFNQGRQELPTQLNVGATYISTDTVEDLMKITGKK